MSSLHFSPPDGLAARVKSHAGGVTRPGTIGVTPSRARNVAPRSPRGRAEAARNPLGDGHLRPSALSFVGGDHPDRHPPHFAPSDRRSPPRLPRDFRHGLLACISHHPTVEARDTSAMTSLRLLAVLNVLSSTPARAKRLAPRPDGPLTHFTSPRAEKCRLSTRCERHGFVALACRAQRTVQVHLRAPSGSRLFPPPGLRLVLTALSRTSPRRVVRHAG